MNSEITYDLHAFITLLPTEKGGRHTPISSGYMPSLTFNTVRHYDGQLILNGKKNLKPGDSGDVTIHMLPAVTLSKNLKTSDSFTLNEGNKAIGSGVILDVLKKSERKVNNR